MKAKSQEHIRNALVAAASVIPMAGGPLGVVLDKYLPNEIENRKSALLEHVANDLRELEKKAGLLRLDTPEFLSTFVKVMRHAIEEHRREKIVAFRNILINKALSSEDGFCENDLYVRLVDQFTVDQIRILHLVYQHDVKGSVDLGQSRLIDYVCEKWSSVDDTYVRSCINELIRWWVVKKREGRETFYTSCFGERFIRYIFSPIDLEEAE